MKYSQIEFPASSPRLLLVEDDPRLREDLDAHFRQRGFAVTTCSTGTLGLDAAETGHFDLVLLDIMLPGLDGLQLLEALRSRQDTPVMLMSALGAEQDRITGFTRGADDYLPKPFSMVEMQVRVDAVLRRVAYERREPEQPSEELELKFDEARSDVVYKGQWADLTPTEFRLLVTFSRHMEEALSKAFLYQHVLHRAYSQHDRSLDMHVSHIRRKLARLDYADWRLETVWGKGYVLTNGKS